jgi:hypothetical protein
VAKGNSGRPYRPLIKGVCSRPFLICFEEPEGAVIIRKRKISLSERKRGNIKGRNSLATTSTRRERCNTTRKRGVEKSPSVGPEASINQLSGSSLKFRVTPAMVKSEPILDMPSPVIVVVALPPIVRTSDDPFQINLSEEPSAEVSLPNIRAPEVKLVRPVPPWLTDHGELSH